LPNLDQIAVDERNGDPIPFGVDANVSRRAAGADDRTASASREEMQARVPLTRHEHAVSGENLDAVELGAGRYALFPPFTLELRKAEVYWRKYSTEIMLVLTAIPALAIIFALL
jgi:hypothetical protein